jgi:ribosomal protein L11 methylase PrmA
LRVIRDSAAPDYEFVSGSGLYQELADKGWVSEFRQLDSDQWPAELAHDAGVHCVLEHEAIPFISYPYEWPFSLLRRAALHHLDLHLYLLDREATLSDASAYNVQFSGVAPTFIDVLSVRRYRPGEYWLGHRQFCDNFLNPLLLRSELGVAHNAFFRGTLEGVSTDELSRLIPFHRLLFSWRKFSNIYLPIQLQKLAPKWDRLLDVSSRPPLPLATFRRLLSGLRNWISDLKPRQSGASAWTHYADKNTYAAEEHAAKMQFVAEFVAEVRPRVVWDLGCNVGAFAENCLRNGAQYVVGFDSDQSALDQAVDRADMAGLSFLPLFMDAANPSPDQGWLGQERASLGKRSNADAMLALAFEHHLAIGRNIPLTEVIEWLVRLAPKGVIEFVPKDDPTIKRMLALREDIFPNYSRAEFEQTLTRRAKVIRSNEITKTGRTLFQYER